MNEAGVSIIKRWNLGQRELGECFRAVCFEDRGLNPPSILSLEFSLVA